MRREVPAAERLKKGGGGLSGDGRSQPPALGHAKGDWTSPDTLTWFCCLDAAILLWRVCNPVDLLQQLITGSVLSGVISEEAFSDYIAFAATLANYVKSRIWSWKSQVWKTRIVFCKFMGKKMATINATGGSKVWATQVAMCIKWFWALWTFAKDNCEQSKTLSGLSILQTQQGVWTFADTVI